MTRRDFAALENVEYKANIDLYRAAAEDVQIAHAVEARDIGPTACLTGRGTEPAAMFRRALRLGVGRETSEAELDDVVARMNGCGLSYAVPVAPQSQPFAVASWLERRGFARGYGWMKFSRPCNGASYAASDLEVRTIGGDLGADFGRVVVEGCGMPSTVVHWVGSLAARANWVWVMAFDDPVPVAAGAVYLDGDYAWLGLGATLASHRRHGARVVVTVTGERLPDRPSVSYRNILRAGFEGTYLRQNYMSP
jgi:hypothetical protein